MNIFFIFNYIFYIQLHGQVNLNLLDGYYVGTKVSLNNLEMYRVFKNLERIFFMLNRK